MMKKMLSTATIAVSIVGVSAMAAPQALADSDTGEYGPGASQNGAGASQAYGNQATHGDMSPQMALVQGSLNKPCIGLPQKLNVGSVVGLIPITVQDIPILSQQQQQQCAENSNQSQGDAPLSHVLEDVPILGENGAGNN